MENFNKILLDYLSPNFIIRSEAEKQINKYINPYGLDLLFQSLSQQTNEQVKLFISILIKKIFDSEINDDNKMIYEEYIMNKKGDIINIILNLKSDIKTVKHLVLVLIKCGNLFENSFSIDDLFDYIFEFYNYNKDLGNIYETFNGLYIAFKLLKEYNKEFKKIEFYIKIINDFSEILNIFLNNNTNNDVLVQYINLYFKIFKYSVNFLNIDQRKQIMYMTFEFLYRVLLNNTNLNKNLFDAIFLSNKILIKYTSYVNKIDLDIIKKFTELFYLYINNTILFENIINIIHINYPSLNKEKKFIIDITDFFKELLQLSSFDNWGDLILFKDCYSDDQILISDYLTKDFFNQERLENIIIFVIKNCLSFTSNEIDLANSDIEEFYLWYDTLSPIYDLREKAGLLCRIIYDKYKKIIKDVFISLENKLLELTNNNTNISLKCGLLSFFDSIAFIYFNKNRNYELWIRSILLNSLSNHIDVYSKYIILRILMKFIDFKEVGAYRNEIFFKVYEIFLFECNSEEGLLIKFAIIDFMFSYFDDIFSNEYPNDFLKNYIQQICELLRIVSSPDIHNKIIKTTVNILDKFNESDIQEVFPQIFPILNSLWNSGWNNTKNLVATRVYIKTYVVRQNLIKLLTLFVKKIGIFIGDFYLYFEFVYNVIGYTISIKSIESNFLIQEGLKLILQIQDEFYKLNIINSNLSCVNKPGEFYIYFNYYLKIYDFLPYILENISISDDYFLVQLLIIEQYLSLIFIPEVKSFLTSINFVEKLIYIINCIIGKHCIDFYQPIYNFIEYCAYMLNINDVNNQFNSYLYGLIENMLSSDNFNILISVIQISNRLIYISKTYDILDFNFSFRMIELCNNIFDIEKLSILQKAIISNFINNCTNIFNTITDNTLIMNCLGRISEIINDKSNFIDKYNHTLDHWLFFFNKMNTNMYYYNLTNIQERYKQIWTDKLEKLNYYEVDLSDINYELKYYSLMNDSMYKIENN